MSLAICALLRWTAVALAEAVRRTIAANAQTRSVCRQPGPHLRAITSPRSTSALRRAVWTAHLPLRLFCMSRSDATAEGRCTTRLPCRRICFAHGGANTQHDACAIGGRKQLAARPVDTRIPANSRKRGGGLTGRGDGGPTLSKGTAEAAFCRLTPGPRASCFLPPIRCADLLVVVRPGTLKLVFNALLNGPGSPVTLTQQR